MDELADFNYDDHKTACYTEKKTGGGNKGDSISFITEERLTTAISDAKYYEDLGRSIDPNIMEWSWIKNSSPWFKTKTTGANTTTS